MKKLVSLLLVVALLASFALVGCGGKNASESETVKIGWIGPLTGDNAVWGTAEKQTVEMLVEQKNAEGGVLGGKQLELVYYDTRGDVAEALNATNRLTAQDKVVGIIGPNSSDAAIAISGTLEKNHVSDIATVATNTKVTFDDGKVKKYNFRVCFIDPYQGAVAAGYAFEKLGLSKAAVLYDVASDYSQGFTEFFIETFEKLGGEIVAKEGFKTGDVDFRAQLTTIKEANPEIILLPYFYKEVALTANQARDLGITATLMGGDGWASAQLMEMAKDSLQGSYIVNHLDFKDPDAVPLTEAYEARWDGMQPELNTYMAHDAFLLLCAAIEKAGAADPEKITDALTQVEVKGVTGNIKMDPETHNPMGKEAAIIQVEGDDYTFIEKYAPPVE